MLDTESQAYSSVASLVLERTLGSTAAKVVTVFILVTAFTSVLAGLLAGSRVPYDAARDGVFFRSFARLHPRHEFPTVGLVTMGVVTAAGFVIGQLTSLTVLIQLLTVVMVLVQALAQIVALTVLRRRQPDLRRPYKMTLYPLPGIVAGLGWLVIYGYADENAPGLHPIELSLLWVAVGVGAFLLWARSKREWPFGPKHIEERYRNADPRLLELDEEDLEESAPAGDVPGERRACPATTLPRRSSTPRSGSSRPSGGACSRRTSSTPWPAGSWTDARAWCCWRHAGPRTTRRSTRSTCWR
jgi:hypothetical protein